MARIRNTKPDTFRDDDLADLSRDVRLLAQGLPCLADARGLLEDRPRRIAADLFPYDEDVDAQVMECWLDQLEQAGWLGRYQAAGGAYIQLLTMERDQRPHRDEWKKLARAVQEGRAHPEPPGAVRWWADKLGVPPVPARVGGSMAQPPPDPDPPRAHTGNDPDPHQDGAGDDPDTIQTGPGPEPDTIQNVSGTTGFWDTGSGFRDLGHGSRERGSGGEPPPAPSGGAPPSAPPPEASRPSPPRKRSRSSKPSEGILEAVEAFVPAWNRFASRFKLPSIRLPVADGVAERLSKMLRDDYVRENWPDALERLEAAGPKEFVVEERLGWDWFLTTRNPKGGPGPVMAILEAGKWTRRPGGRGGGKVVAMRDFMETVMDDLEEMGVPEGEVQRG